MSYSRDYWVSVGLFTGFTVFFLCSTGFSDWATDIDIEIHFSPFGPLSFFATWSQVGP